MPFLLSAAGQCHSFRRTAEIHHQGSVALLDEIYRKGEMSNVALVSMIYLHSGYYGYGLRYGYTLGYGHRYYDPGNYYTKDSNKESQDTIQMIKILVS